MRGYSNFWASAVAIIALTRMDKWIKIYLAAFIPCYALVCLNTNASRIRIAEERVLVKNFQATESLFML
jgi:hypothetical protein